MLFSIDPITEPGGVWLVLSVEDLKEEYDPSNIEDTIVTPERLATKSFPLLSTSNKNHHNNNIDDNLSPRDVWIRNIKYKFIWLLTRRYSFRVNWAPNFPINVKANVYSARGMLSKGKITWKANQHDMESFQQQEDIRRLEDVPLWPCPRLYVHIVAKNEGVFIPPLSSQRKIHGVFWSRIFKIAEAYIGPLTNKIAQEEAAAASRSIPVHLIFEPLYLFVIPKTSLSLLIILVPLLFTATLFIIPPLSAAFTSMAAKEKHIKTE